jgi:hypothetical protein
MVLNRPILYYDTADAASIMTMPQSLLKIRRVTLPFQTAQGAFEIIKNQRWKVCPADPEIRKELVEFRFYDIGQAANRAVQSMYSLLNLSSWNSQDHSNSEYFHLKKGI